MTSSPGLPWVVLVEDDEALQQTLAGALERAPDVAVRPTHDPEEAFELARDSRSRLLITEEQSVSVDGLSLAACVRQQRAQLPLHDGLGFRGEICASGLIELVQLVAMTTPSAALHLESGSQHGSVWFEDGAIVHARFGAERGSAAFRRMLRLSSGSFRIETTAPAPERTVACSMAGFLLESACELDEEGESGVHAWFGSGVEPRAATGPSAADYFESGLQAARGKRYHDALPDWERAASLDPDNRIYQHNLLRLRRLLDSEEPLPRR